MVEKVNYAVAYSQVYEILNLLGKNFIDKLPNKLYEEIKQKRKKDYIPTFIDKDGVIDENKISRDAVAIFTFLNIKYFIEDENEKNRIMKKILNNNKEKTKNV